MARKRHAFRRSLAALCAVAALWLPALAAPRSDGRVEDFRLLDERGVPHELYRYAGQKAIVVIAQMDGCPIIEKYSPDIRALKERFGPRGVAVLLVNPSDGRAAIERYARRFEPGVPILLDESGLVASLLGFERSAEAVVIDPSSWRVVYRGAIDDKLYYGGQKSAASRSYLADALEALLSGAPIPASRTRALGCLLNLRAGAPASYVRDVAPLLEASCLRCHAREDDPAPLRRYEDVVKWAPMIRETLLTRLMPPGAADWTTGPFQELGGLDPEKTRALARWIDNGAPRGEGADPLPAAAGVVRARSERAPDLVFSMPRPESIPAAGLEPYRYVLLGTFEEDFRAGGVVVRHADPGLVHHEILYLFPPGAPLPPLGPADSDRVALVTPGEVPSLTPWRPGSAGAVSQPVAKGTRLILEIHYRTVGRPASDLARVELYEQRDAGAPRLRALFIQNADFRIPPGARDYEVAARRVLDRPCVARGFFVHMHSRGDHAAIRARYPDGRAETLLSLPLYDWTRPHVYALSAPKPLPAGTVVELDGGFDNSAANPANPDAARRVQVGMRVTDEMLFAALYVTER